MSDSTSLFQKIDQFIFRQVDQFKNTSFFMKLQDKYTALDDNLQKILQQILVLALFLIPLLLLLLLWSGNQSLRKDYQLRLKTLQTANKVLNLKKSFDQQSFSLFKNSPISSQQEVENKIRSALTQAKIQPTQISLKEYSLDEQDSYSAAQIKVSLKSLNLNQFTRLAQGLIVNEGFKIVETEITRSNSDKELSGDFLLKYFFRKIAPLKKK